ncbi:MAG: hypothetical protein ACR2GU_05935 [Rubrobacteraceae bacterium]
MGSRRGGRDDSPLAGLLRRSPQREDNGRREQVQEPVRSAADPGVIAESQTMGVHPGAGRRRSGEVVPGTLRKKRGRPRGGRRSNPAYIQISARIHKDVRFSLEKTLAERSAREGRYVEMAEVIEDLMRFYVDHGDPYQMLEER